MNTFQKWTYGVLLFCIILAMVFLQYSYDTFHIMRMCIMGLLVSIPIVFGNRKFKEYTFAVLAGVSLYMISAHVTTRNGGDNEIRMVFSCIIYVVFTRAFMSFKGFTFKTTILLFLSMIAIAFFYFFGREIKGERYLLSFYVILFVNMVWQAINLFAMRTSRGNLFILIFAVMYIIINLLGGINLYLVNSHLLDICSQVLHWIALLFLVHSTTLGRKEFHRLL